MNAVTLVAQEVPNSELRRQYATSLNIHSAGAVGMNVLTSGVVMSASGSPVAAAIPRYFPRWIQKQFPELKRSQEHGLKGHLGEDSQVASKERKENKRLNELQGPER